MFWKRKQTIDPEQVGWKIIRNKPARQALGIAIPTFINNYHFHLATVDVYEDGAIDCWGFLDLSLFRKKVASGKIATQPPVGSRVVIFNLGSAEVDTAEWLIAPSTMRSAVEDALRILNPTSTDLLDMHGDDTEVRDGIRCAKLGLADQKPYRISQDGEQILGAELPLFRLQDGEFEVAQLFVYSDGYVEVEGDELQPIEQLSARFDEGELTLDVPNGSWITVPPFGRFKTSEGCWGVEAEERVKEAFDELDKLRGNEGSIHRCILAHEAFNEDASEENKRLLLEAYEQVPKHLRMYCGDMDTKDWPIRKILYGQEPE